jgi:hypothetical protein
MRRIITATIVSLGPVAFAAPCAPAAPSGHPFAIEPGSFHITTSTSQAGAHEDLTTEFKFEHEDTLTEETYGEPRTTIVNLPAGFLGSNTAVPTCTDAQLSAEFSNAGGEGCPPDTQVGTIEITLGLRLDEAPETDKMPVFNMESNVGVAATLGFKVADLLTQILPVSLRPSDSGLTIESPSIVDTEISKIKVVTWGVPESPVHNAERGEATETYPTTGRRFLSLGGVEVHVPIKPFLSLPTQCSGEPFIATMKSNSWEEPENWSEAETEIPAVTGCERLPFFPSLEVTPTTRSAESSSGLNVSLVVPQTYEDPETLATSNLKANTVALPVGYTANPSLASGLGVCTPEQLEAETAAGLPGSGCPAESKIGSVEVETPLLAEKLTGAVYIAKPFDNPFDSLLALYIVVRDPVRGLLVTLAGKITPNPVTGQLVTTFGARPAYDGIPASEGNPQVAFSRFTLKLRQGANSPLVSPPACGTYTASALFTSWAQPLIEVPLTNSFQVETGIGGGACPAGGVPPFKPGLVAGTLNNSAGAYSPMDIHITRNDGEQEITRFSSILPPGLIANLSGVPFCPNADIEAAKLVSGAEEEADPSCPAASEIGHTLVGAGVGSVLAYTPGRIYMAGPYNGAPFSVVSITSAKVGPFDLGTVVIRFALEINPETAAVTVDAKASDPIPHIIDGIIVHVRDIHVYVDRPNFTINPTNCDPMTYAVTVGGGGADPTNPADQQFVTVDNGFQAANCQTLTFKPILKISTQGKTSRSEGASLTARLTYPHVGGHSILSGGPANIKSVKVDLPKQLPSRLTTLQKACTEQVFDANPAGCPAASIVGHATAVTPILPEALTGPAYFVSHGGAKFPELVMVLQGYGVTLDIRGETFINKAGITSSTFRVIPDAPVGTFELTLPQGPDSALAANGSLCATTKTVTVKKKVTVKVHGHKRTVTRKIKQTKPESLTMPTAFVGQNGAEIHQNTPIAVEGCPKSKAKSRKTGR